MVKTYDMPAQPLEDALNLFARNAGVLLSFYPDLTAGALSKALAGDTASATASPICWPAPAIALIYG